jgi:hypothetical protein
MLTLSDEGRPTTDDAITVIGPAPGGQHYFSLVAMPRANDDVPKKQTSCLQTLLVLGIRRECSKSHWFSPAICSLFAEKH